MKKILTIAAALALCGCSSVNFDRTDAQGNKTTTSFNSFLQSRKGVKVTGKDASGLEIGFEEENVTGDVQMVQAIDTLVGHLAAIAAKQQINPTNSAPVTNLPNTPPVK